MMEDANILCIMKYKIIQEAIIMATKLDGLVVTTINSVTQTWYEQFGMDIPKFIKYLRTWGEAGVVKTKSKTSTKLLTKGTTCMIVGYSD